LWRRGFLLAPFVLGACGFRPMHLPENAAAPTTDSGLARELAAVRVALIPERNGQLMRRDLQRRLEGSLPGTPARYELQTYLAVTAEVLGYRRDGAISRVRYLASAPWVLTTLGSSPTVIGRNTARTLDAFNIPDQQFFAADASRLDMERRIVEELSERVYEGVVIALRARPAS
jgi:LPS-assembly lipoprotein